MKIKNGITFFVMMMLLNIIIIPEQTYADNTQCLSPQSNTTKEGIVLSGTLAEGIIETVIDGVKVYIIRGTDNLGNPVEVKTTPFGGQAFSWTHNGKALLHEPPKVSEITKNIFAGGMPVAAGFSNRVPKNADGKAVISWNDGQKVRDVEVQVRHPWGPGAPFAIHGSTWFETWDVIKTGYLEEYGAQGITYELDSRLEKYADVRKELFSDLIFRLTYYLDANGLLCSVFECENAGKEEAPVQITWHPWLNLPGNREDWELWLPFNSVWAVDGNKYPTGERLPINADTVNGFMQKTNIHGRDYAVIQLGKNEFDHFFTDANKSLDGSVMIGLFNPKLGIHFWVTQEQLSDFVFYSDLKTPNFFFACMEPANGPANAINLHGTIPSVPVDVVKPGKAIRKGIAFGYVGMSKIYTATTSPAQQALDRTLSIIDGAPAARSGLQTGTDTTITAA
ncbi:MAG: aldose 1-epimerase [Candidatus Aureabacteria bacterium]|nr:aldose 1-epimerase [Candidatus Auribacterota bacterium]